MNVCPFLLINHMFLSILQKKINQKKKKDQKVEVDQVLQNDIRNIKVLIHTEVEIGMFLFYYLYSPFMIEKKVISILLYIGKLR